MPLAPIVQVQRTAPDGTPVTGLVLNPVKSYVRNFWLTPDTIAPVLAAEGTAGDTVELKFLIDSQGHFDWAYIVGVSTGAYSLDFFDGGTQRRLQNKPVHSSTIVGAGVRPFKLFEPYFFNVGDSQRELICTIRNLTATNNTVRLVLYGRRFYHREAPPSVALEIDKKFGLGWRTYSYFLTPNETTNYGEVTAVGALGTASFIFESDANADTEIQKAMVSSTGAFTYQLRERATNRTLMNGVVHSTSGWGNAEFPFYFADTYYLERLKQLIFEVTDLSGAPNKIFATLAGRRLQYV